MIIREEIINDCRLILGDCLEVMPLLGEFDAVLTDPPYGINANKQTLGSVKKEFHRGENWDKSRPDLDIHSIPSKKLIIWGGNYFTDILPPSNDWLIWHKKNDGLSFSECEMAWSNVGKQVRHLSHHWGGEEKRHPTQKPIAVMKWCLGFLPKAQTILDPFMGSGTTGVACVKTGRSFTGIELDPEYFEIACERIRKAYDQPDFFVEQAKEPEPEPEQEELL